MTGLSRADTSDAGDMHSDVHSDVHSYVHSDVHSGIMNSKQFSTLRDQLQEVSNGMFTGVQLTLFWMIMVQLQ